MDASGTMTRAAARGGHLELLQWALANGCLWYASLCFWAVRSGHLDILKWARENGCRWTTGTRDWAAELGYIDNEGRCDESDDESDELF